MHNSLSTYGWASVGNHLFQLGQVDRLEVLEAGHLLLEALSKVKQLFGLVYQLSQPNLGLLDFLGILEIEVVAAREHWF